jgi:hypothetical protein
LAKRANSLAPIKEADEPHRRTANNFS